MCFRAVCAKCFFRFRKQKQQVVHSTAATILSRQTFFCWSLGRNLLLIFRRNLFWINQPVTVFFLHYICALISGRFKTYKDFPFLRHSRSFNADSLQCTIFTPPPLSLSQSLCLFYTNLCTRERQQKLRATKNVNIFEVAHKKFFHSLISSLNNKKAERARVFFAYQKAIMCSAFGDCWFFQQKIFSYCRERQRLMWLSCYYFEQEIIIIMTAENKNCPGFHSRLERRRNFTTAERTADFYGDGRVNEKTNKFRRYTRNARNCTHTHRG